MRWFGLAAFILVLAGFVGWLLADRSMPRSNGVPTSPSSEVATTVDQTASGEPREAVPPAPAPPQRTAEEVLEEYWGPRWPEVRRALVAAGKDLSEPFELRPWEESADEIHQVVFQLNDSQRKQYRDNYLAWPDELTGEWLQQNVDSRAGSLDAVQLQEIRELAVPTNQEIEWRLEEFEYELGAELERRWLDGNFQKAPFSTEGLALPAEGGGWYAASCAAGSWTARVFLTRAENGDLKAKQQELLSLRIQRDAAVKNRVKALVERDR